MKISLDLATDSSPEWVEAVMADFPAFLQDHADCERKASAMAMSFVAKYPDRVEILPELIETGIEELEHFREVFQIMAHRGIRLTKEMAPDPYIHQLLQLCYSDPLRRFLDRLLLASIIECRGAERFRLIYEAIQNDEDLKGFYLKLATSEAKHGNIFVKMALRYFPKDQVWNRLKELNAREGEILKALPIRSALH